MKLTCFDTDPEHVHDDGACCECASPFHCCGGCPVFVHPITKEVKRVIPQ